MDAGCESIEDRDRIVRICGSDRIEVAVGKLTQIQLGRNQAEEPQKSGKPGASDNSAHSSHNHSRADVSPSVVLIAPTEEHFSSLKQALGSQRAKLLRDFNSYPSFAQLPGLIAIECDAFLVEIDSDIDVAMELVEAICTRKTGVTVVVYSGSADPNRMVRSMQAGAREYLSGTIEPTALQQALIRAAVRRSEQTGKRISGQMLLFWGAKGGSGATTLATNFAIALRKETEAKIALLDLNPDLGEVALLLGVSPQFTVLEALRNSRRLDQEFVSTLVTKHGSGVSLVAAPDDYTSGDACDRRAVGKLIEIVRSQYAYAVVDAGRGLGSAAEPLFQMASTVYVITQLDIPSLRNAQRFIQYAQRLGSESIQLVVNRFDARRSEFNDERIAKALGISPNWKVPNDYGAVHRSLNTGSPLITETSPVAITLQAMARAACGKPPIVHRRSGWKLFS